MAKQSQKNEVEKKVIKFQSIKDANEYLEALDIEALSNNEVEVASSIDELKLKREYLSVAIRKVLTGKEASREPLRKIYQELFNTRADTHQSKEDREKAKRHIAVLKRATRTATDKDANSRGLWAFDYSIVCNTIENGNIAKFDIKKHKTDDDGDDEKSKIVVTDIEQVFDYVIFRINNEDFKKLASIVETRFALEQQDYDSKDIIFVDAVGKTPAHFEVKQSA